MNNRNKLNLPSTDVEEGGGIYKKVIYNPLEFIIHDEITDEIQPLLYNENVPPLLYNFEKINTL